MTPALPPHAALARLATLTPGLGAAALVDADGRLLAGDAELAAEIGRDAGAVGRVVVVRGTRLAVAARVEGPVLEGLLRADLADVLAAVGDDRAA